MNNYQERKRQQEFIDKMVANGYELLKPSIGQYVNYEDIKKNFKIKLEQTNNLKLSDSEFERIYAKFNQGTVFDRSWKLLREEDIVLDNGKTKTLKLLNKEKWCQNEFQIAQEVETKVAGIDGKKARFDSVIFINGLPLIIMEFKQSAIGKDKGLNQIIDYQKDGKMHDLFLYCQIFIASSFATTRYFANNNKINKEFVFKWTDEQNNEISALIDGNKTIYDTLLSRCFLAEMIVRYMIRKESDKVNVILRPYQVYATKKILQKVEENSGSGYIFHTTGSGKTITSFKTCKLISENPKVDKVIFLVDRKDLDAQTKENYDEFEKGCYDKANNTKQFKNSLLSNSKNIKVGTIQKMTRIINSLSEAEQETLNNSRVVIIIDECHRSQSDDTVNALRRVFNKNAQYFGFTGTPISEKNQKSGNTNYKTTKSVFDKELHRYSITDAIRDNNVLQFNISQPKEIVEQEINFMDENRIEVISKHIIDNFNNYTDNRVFNTIFATSSKEQLKLYYKALKKINATKSEVNKIKFTSIFSTNPDDNEEYVDVTKKEDEFIAEVINDYNESKNTNLDVKDIEGFKSRVYDDVRNKDVDLVLVVNMLLTGFDSPITKTLFVDKNLKYHGLLQAYSRVNRKYPQKFYGNVVTFINQKERRDEALELFSAGGTFTDFKIENYEKLVQAFNEHLSYTKGLCENGDDLRKQLKDGDLEKLENSLKAIKELQKKYNFIKIHPDFKEKDLGISRRELNDLKDVYKEVCRELGGDKEEIADDTPAIQMDFELGLFDEDIVSLEYLLKLTQNNLKLKTKVEVQLEVEGYDIPLEIRTGLAKAINEYDETTNKDIIEYLKEILEQDKYTQYYDYANKHEIKDIEKFIELVLEQERGNITASQASQYDEIKDLSFVEKRNFRKKTFNFVENVAKTYNISL